MRTSIITEHQLNYLVPETGGHLVELAHQLTHREVLGLRIVQMQICQTGQQIPLQLR
jgi:hypothetical protein